MTEATIPSMGNFEIHDLEREDYSLAHACLYLMDTDNYRSKTMEDQNAQAQDLSMIGDTTAPFGGLLDHVGDNVRAFIMDEASVVCMEDAKMPAENDVVMFIHRKTTSQNDIYMPMVKKVNVGYEYTFMGDAPNVKEFWKFYEKRCVDQEVAAEEAEEFPRIYVPEILTFDELFKIHKGDFNLFGTDSEMLNYIQSFTKDEIRASAFLNIYKAYRKALFSDDDRVKTSGIIPVLCNGYKMMSDMDTAEAYIRYKKPLVERTRYNERRYDAYSGIDSDSNRSYPAGCSEFPKSFRRMILLDDHLAVYLPIDSKMSLLARPETEYKYIFPTDVIDEYMHERVEAGDANIASKYTLTNVPTKDDAFALMGDQTDVSEHMARVLLYKYGAIFDILAGEDFASLKEALEKANPNPGQIASTPGAPSTRAANSTPPTPRADASQWRQFIDLVKSAANYEPLEEANALAGPSASGAMSIEIIPSSVLLDANATDDIIRIMKANKDIMNKLIRKEIIDRFSEKPTPHEDEKYPLLIKPFDRTEPFLYTYTEIAEIKQGEDTEGYAGNMLDQTSGLSGGYEANDPSGGGPGAGADEDDARNNIAYGEDGDGDDKRDDQGNDAIPAPAAAAPGNAENDLGFDGNAEQEYLQDQEQRLDRVFISDEFYESVVGSTFAASFEYFVRVLKELDNYNVGSFTHDIEKEWWKKKLEEKFKADFENNELVEKGIWIKMFQDYVFEVWIQACKNNQSYGMYQVMDMNPRHDWSGSKHLVHELLRNMIDRIDCENRESVANYKVLCKLCGTTETLFAALDLQSLSAKISEVEEEWVARSKRSCQGSFKNMKITSLKDFATMVQCNGRIEYSLQDSVSKAIQEKSGGVPSSMRKAIWVNKLDQKAPELEHVKNPNRIIYKVHYGIPDIRLVHPVPNATAVKADNADKAVMPDFIITQSRNILDNIKVDAKLRYRSSKLDVQVFIRAIGAMKRDLSGTPEFVKVLEFLKKAEDLSDISLKMYYEKCVIFFLEKYKQQITIDTRDNIRTMVRNALEVQSVNEIQNTVTLNREKEKLAALARYENVSEERKQIIKAFNNL